MNLCDGDFVTIQVTGVNEGNIPLTNSNGGMITVQMFSPYNYDGAWQDYVTVATFGNSQLTCDQTIYIQVAEGTAPGDYTGTVTFNINLAHS